MKNTIKILMLIYFLFADFILFAQPGDDDDGGGDGLEGNDPPTASINTKLWYLIIIAVVYAYFVYKKRNALVKK